MNGRNHASLAVGPTPIAHPIVCTGRLVACSFAAAGEGCLAHLMMGRGVAAKIAHLVILSSKPHTRTPTSRQAEQLGKGCGLPVGDGCSIGRRESSPKGVTRHAARVCARHHVESVEEGAGSHPKEGISRGTTRHQQGAAAPRSVALFSAHHLTYTHVDLLVLLSSGPCEAP